MIKKLLALLFPTMTTSKALKGLAKAHGNLLKASSEADKLAEAHKRLVEYHMDVVEVAESERDRAKRVSDRLEDLLA